MLVDSHIVYTYACHTAHMSGFTLFDPAGMWKVLTDFDWLYGWIDGWRDGWIDGGMDGGRQPKLLPTAMSWLGHGCTLAMAWEFLVFFYFLVLLPHWDNGSLMPRPKSPLHGQPVNLAVSGSLHFLANPRTRGVWVIKEKQARCKNQI